MSFSTNRTSSSGAASVGRSIMGTIRDRLKRRPEGNQSSQSPSTENAGNSAGSSSTGPPQPRLATRDVGHIRSPLANRSPATRRPEAPPSYNEAISSPVDGVARAASPTPSNISNASRLSAQDLSSAEDPYAFLTTFDTIFVIDDSGSMAGRSWREVRAVLGNITPICTSHDADGIDIYFLNHKTPAGPPGPGKAAGGYTNVRDARRVEEIFQAVRPGGATPTGTRIQSILRPYLRHYEEMARANPDPEIKPINVIVITDGVPTDELEGVLHSAAQKLDTLDAPSFQVGVQFFLVGNEPGAADYLRHLDDNLGDLIRGSGVRDIVDTVTWDARAGNAAGLTADGILKAVLGAVIKRLDRLPTGAPQSPRQYLNVR